MKSTAGLATVHRGSGHGRNRSGRRVRALLATLALALCALALSASSAFADPPTVVMGGVSNVSYASAHVSGEIDPGMTEEGGGPVAEYTFEISKDDINWTPAASGEMSAVAPGLQEVSKDLTGLKGGTEYFVRLSAYNFEFFNPAGNTGQSSPPDPSFTTLPVDPPAVVSVDDASNVLYNIAELSGKVFRPEGNANAAFDVDCHFEYVTDDQFNVTGFEGASSAPCKPANPVKAEGESDVSAKLTGLASGTTYHLRLHAENTGGTDTKMAADTFTTLSSPPAPGVQIDPVTTFTDSTAHLSGKIDTHGAATSWHFQCSPACGEPAGSLDGGFAEDEVSADISGLEPNTTFQVELIASGEGGQGEDAVIFKTAFRPPLAQTLFAGEVGADFATVAGKVNPRNATVTYKFEYGLDENYGASAPSPAASLGQVDNQRHEVSQELVGLQPESTYHFRISVTNTEGGETSHGADHTFTTQPVSGPKACANEQLRAENNSLRLPDCRAYELVSPVQKSGNQAGAKEERAGYSMATAGGNGVLYITSGPQGDARRGLQAYSISHRGANGWASESAIPSGSHERIYATTYGAESLLPSSDLSSLLFVGTGSWVPQNPEGSGGVGLYLGHADDSVEWLSEPQIPFGESTPPPGSFSRYSELQPIGASPDLSTFYFWSAPNLLAGETSRTSSGGWGLYEYSNGVLKSAATLPPTAEHPEGIEPPGGAAPASSGRSNRVTVANESGPNTFGNQVSRDGSTLFFVSPDPFPVPSGSGQPFQTQLYVRSGGHSTLISRMADGTPAPDGASPVRTLNNFREPIFQNGAQYAFASPDGKTAIFQSVDALTPSSPVGGGTYRYDVEADTITYLPGVSVGTPSGFDGSVAAISDDGNRFLFSRNGYNSASAGSEGGVWDNGVISRIKEIAIRTPARATASGSAFVFSGEAAPGAGFNAGGENVNQIFRYDVGTDQTSCLSCPPDGTQPTGDAHLSEMDVRSSTAVSPEGEMLGNRGISEDGSRVFFDSPDALVPEDTNGARDVYEWTSSGLSLISSGKSPTPSFVLDNSANGNDVFFTTPDDLDPRDVDGLYDVYDARVGGGFPQASAVSPCSENATCKDDVPSALGQSAPATNSFSGPGNPAPCPKGRIRKHGRCIKQQKPRKHRHHKHAHKNNKRTAGHGRGGSK